MRRFAASVVALFVSFIVIGATACGEDRPTCYEGDYRACDCDAGADTGPQPTGLEMCLPSHDGYGPCVCNGPTPGLDSGRGSGGGGGDGGGG